MKLSIKSMNHLVLFLFEILTWNNTVKNTKMYILYIFHYTVCWAWVMLAGSGNKARTVLENWNCHYISCSGTSIEQCAMFKFIANAERMKTLQFLQISVGIGFREMNVTKHKNRWLPLWMCTFHLYALISFVYFFTRNWSISNGKCYSWLIREERSVNRAAVWSSIVWLQNSIKVTFWNQNFTSFH